MDHRDGVTCGRWLVGSDRLSHRTTYTPIVRFVEGRVVVNRCKEMLNGVESGNE